MTFEAFTTAERNGWHDRAEGYETHTALATLQIVPAMLDALRLRPGMQLLDVACGPGYVAGAAAALNVIAEGVDYAQGMVDAAKTRFPALTFQQGDAEALPVADAQFDAVACNMGLFHIVSSSSSKVSLSFSACDRLLPDGEFYKQCLQRAFTALFEDATGQQIPGGHR